MRKLINCRPRDEQGAIAIVFALLLGGGVLLGCVALTVDYGNLNANHSQLQSSADAAAKQAALQCATDGACPPATGLDAISQDNDNTPAHPSTVTALCGTGAGLDACPDADNDNNTLMACPEFSTTHNFVQAVTQKGSHFYFTDNGQGRDATGQACAAVAWGKIGSHTAVLPVTFSACEWQQATNGDPLDGDPAPTYAPNPPYPPNPPSSLERKIMLAKSTSTCYTFNGHDAPGGFGWVDGNNCQTSATTGDWIHVDTGNNTPSSCDLGPLQNHVVLIPVFDCMNSTGSWPADPSTQCNTGNGQHNYYHVAGFAAFYLTGWNLSGSSQASSVTGTMPCTGSARCLGGFFVKDTGEYGDISDDPDVPDFGANTIQPIG